MDKQALAIDYIEKCREVGLSDAEIGQRLGLRLRGSVVTDRAKQILKAVEDGVIAPTDSYRSMAKKLGIDHPYKVNFQVTALKKAGLWPNQP